MKADNLPWSPINLVALTGKDGLMTDGDWVESKDQDPDGQVRLIQLADVGDGEFLNKSARFLNKAKALELRCTFLQPGDVLIARMPDPLGRACIFPGVGQEAVTAVDVCVWRAGKGGANAQWLVYAINSPPVREQMGQLAGGTTRQRISGGNLKRLEIPTPPSKEQGRIVAKLDTLFRHTRSARAELEHSIALVDRLERATLEKAFRGELLTDA